MNKIMTVKNLETIASVLESNLDALESNCKRVSAELNIDASLDELNKLSKLMEETDGKIYETRKALAAVKRQLEYTTVEEFIQHMHDVIRMQPETRQNNIVKITVCGKTLVATDEADLLNGILGAVDDYMTTIC